MTAADDPELAFASREAWERWLEQHHDEADGVWLKLAKKGTDHESVSRADALEVALCYGWIDGQARSLGDEWWVQRFTPRRARSKWSQVNRNAATKLIERGLMKPSGLREVERAKADGRWDAAYEPPSKATVPDDLQAALDKDEKASAFFATLDSRNRYSILHRIQTRRGPRRAPAGSRSSWRCCATGRSSTPERAGARRSPRRRAAPIR